MKQFYTHLVEIESIVIELDKMDLSKEQKIHLTTLIDSTLHHTILDSILSQLGDSDKRVFLQSFSENDHDKIWKFLTERVDNIEDTIKKAVEDLKEQLHKDLKEAKKS